MTGSLDDGPRQARALRNAISPPPDPFAARFLRGELFELAMRWGGQQHRRLAHKCRTHPCGVATLTDGDQFWPADFEPPHTLALDMFVAHVTAIRDELARTHGSSIADRAAALFDESGGTTTVEDVARMLGTHPSTLRRAFQRQFGRTAREYLRRVRGGLVEQGSALPGVQAVPGRNTRSGAQTRRSRPDQRSAPPYGTLPIDLT